MGINCGDAPGTNESAVMEPRSFCQFSGGVFLCTAFSLKLKGVCTGNTGKGECICFSHGRCNNRPLKEDALSAYELGLIRALRDFEKDELSNLTHDRFMFPEERARFHECIEKLQNMIASRSIRRAHPDLWNTFPGEEEESE